MIVSETVSLSGRCPGTRHVSGLNFVAGFEDEPDRPPIVEQTHPLAVAQIPCASLLRMKNAEGGIRAPAQKRHAGKGGVALKKTCTVSRAHCLPLFLGVGLPVSGQQLLHRA